MIQCPLKCLAIWAYSTSSFLIAVQMLKAEELFMKCFPASDQSVKAFIFTGWLPDWAAPELGSIVSDASKVKPFMPPDQAQAEKKRMRMVISESLNGTNKAVNRRKDYLAGRASRPLSAAAKRPSQRTS